MTLHDHDQHNDVYLIREESDSEDAGELLTRRAVLRRSFLGISGIGLASILAACGDEDGEDDVDEDVDDQEEEAENEEEEDSPSGVEDIDEEPAGDDPEPGGGADMDNGGGDAEDIQESGA